MRDNRTIRYVRAYDSAPARNHPGSVGVAIVGVRARQTTECRLVGTISLGDMAALRTFATGIPGIDKDHRNARALRLVRNESRQLVEGPTVENDSLPAPKRIHAVSNAGKILPA